MGTQHQDVIEINGKKYDAVTGKIIDNSSSQQSTVAPSKKSVNRTNGAAIDGFVKKSRTSHNPHHSTKSVQKSQTLMRSAVKKPAKPSSSPSSNPAIVANITKPQLGQSAQRQKAASEIHKSPHISRFGDSNHRSSVTKIVQDLPVKQQISTQTVSDNQESVSPTVKSDFVNQQPNSTRSKATTALIEKALSNAHAHELPTHPTTHKKGRKKLAHKLGVSARTMAISSTVLAGVLLGGFFALQNVPNLSMRVAAARAGFDATMPGYNPSGFSFNGPINYSPGQVTISFKSNTDDRAYNVTERASNWNSDALLSNFVAVGNGQYQTYQDRGRTLYIYNGSNATWVDNGIWYQIEGESAMTTDQLVRIAASI